MAKQDVLQVVVFATLIGVAAAHVKGKSGPFLNVMDSFVAVMFQLTDYVMALTPLGVFGAMAGSVSSPRTLACSAPTRSSWAPSTGRSSSSRLLVLIPALLIVRAPIIEFFKKIREPFLLAFSTASSEAALPRALEKMVEYGVPKSVAGFVIPAGYSFNLDGSTLYISLASLTIAQAAGIKMSLETELLMMLTFLLTSKGVAGVPRASLVIIAAGCAAFNLPGEAGVAMILAVDEIMDMARTSINVMGNCVASVVVARWEGVLGKPAHVRDESSPAVGGGEPALKSGGRSRRRRSHAHRTGASGGSRGDDAQVRAPHGGRAARRTAELRQLVDDADLPRFTEGTLRTGRTGCATR